MCGLVVILLKKNREFIKKIKRYMETVMVHLVYYFLKQEISFEILMMQ